MRIAHVALLCFGFALGLTISVAPAADEDETDEAFQFLFSHHGNSDENVQKRQAFFDEICQDPARKKRMLERIIRELKKERGPRLGQIMTIPNLSALDGQEYVPWLRDKFAEYKRESRCVGQGYERLPLMQAIAHFLPEKERIRFLMATDNDESEAPVVRFHATLMLCESGDDVAIRYVLSAYHAAQEKYTRTRFLSVDQQQQYSAIQRKPDDKPWDQDRDMIADFTEQGLLLDTSNADTDGDGLLDGNDRNPLCAPVFPDPDTAEIARFLLYLHTKYTRNTSGPYSAKIWIVSTTSDGDEAGVPDMFRGVEFTGIDGVVLHLDRQQRREYLHLHGYGTPRISLSEYPERDGDERIFSFFEGVGPLASVLYEIRMKCFNGVWLPVKRKVLIIS